MRFPLAIAAAGLMSLGSPAEQGSAVVDEATFIVTRNGAPIGRESFKIIRAPGPGGQVYRAVASSALGEDRISTTLTTDSTGAPVAYESTLSLRGEVQERIQGRGRTDRFSVLVQTKGGEAVNEYVVRPGTIVLEGRVFYQYYFAARAGAEVSAIAPRAGRQEVLRVEDLGTEELAIGRQRVSGRRLAVVDASGGRRDIWVDRTGRLLKVALPDQGLLATRDDPPR